MHALQPRGLTLLEELFPGLTAELVGRGAVLGGLRWHLAGQRLRLPPGGRPGLFLSRPLLEGRIRARVAARRGVTLVPGRAVAGLETTPDGRRVSGVRTSDAGSVGAELVVDASGRGSRTPVWLGELGYRSPIEDRVEVGLRYSTRTYRLRPGALDGDAGILTAATRDRPRAALLAAVEGGRHVVTAAGMAGDPPPTDPVGFADFLTGLPARDITEALVAAQPLDDPVPFRFPAGVRRRYEDLWRPRGGEVDRFPAGLLVAGDAICSFNPIYGQGMSVAAMEATVLRAMLAGGGVPAAGRYFRAVAGLLDGPWSLAAGTDLGFPHATGRRGAAIRVLTAYLPRLHAAAANDPDLAVAFLRVTGLQDRPTSLLRPDRVARVLLAGGRRHGGSLRSAHP